MPQSEAQRDRRRARARERREADPEYHQRRKAQCRDYYYRNQEAQQERARAWRAANPGKAQAASRAHHEQERVLLSSLKVGKSCADCAWECTEANYQAFDWDHRPGVVKVFAISQAHRTPRRSREEILAEVAKCDLRCRNCHAIVTHQRRQEAKSA